MLGGAHQPSRRVAAVALRLGLRLGSGLGRDDVLAQKLHRQPLELADFVDTRNWLLRNAALARLEQLDEALELIGARATVDRRRWRGRAVAAGRRRAGGRRAQSDLRRHGARASFAANGAFGSADGVGGEGALNAADGRVAVGDGSGRLYALELVGV